MHTVKESNKKRSYIGRRTNRTWTLDQMLKPAQVTEATILTLPDIANTFGFFVVGELRKAARVQRK
ncbi:hypothetical protein [Paraburkholderia sp. RL17-347-BIC-D]|uniref:hypothetical protein n=1 Tax=Paraburkholderia sp. RL17-347-BIC-D TaxID=3031632 RepID=UPI0038B82590